MPNTVLDGILDWQPDASTADTNLPVAATSIGQGTPGDLAGELRRIKSELRGDSLLKSWERWKGLLNLAATGPVAFTFSTATTFLVNDNFVGASRPVAILGRRVAAILSGSTIYGTIVAAAFASPNTTVTVQWDSGALDATLTEIQFGIQQQTVPALQFPKRKTTNENTTNATLHSDAELFINGILPGFYDFDMQVFYQAPAVAGLQIGFSVSVGATGVYSVLFQNAGLPLMKILNTLATATTYPGDGTLQPLWVRGTVNFIDPQGIFQFVWSQATTNAQPCGIIAGSTLVLRKFG